jgi:hypothetical protein
MGQRDGTPRNQYVESRAELVILLFRNNSYFPLESEQRSISAVAVFIPKKTVPDYCHYVVKNTHQVPCEVLVTIKLILLKTG